MIKQKTIMLYTTTTVGSSNALSFEAVQIRVNETADKLLEELEDAGDAFVSLQISHMPECNSHRDRIFVTLVYRETITRKVLVEKTLRV